MRMLVRFGKNRRLRFISHLDLQRFFQRALNRSGLPIAYSQGFNPHAVMAFASALALGWTSEYEVIDVKLSENVKRTDVVSAMISALPDDLPIYEVKLVDDRYSSLMPLVKMSDYAITGSGVNGDMVGKFMSMEHVPAVKITKSGEHNIDARPLVYDLHMEGDALFARLALTEADTLKPDLLISLLTGEEKPDALIHRKALLGVKSKGVVTPIMDM